MSDHRKSQGKPTPLIQGCPLYKKTSANGRTYLTGRLGGLRVLIMPRTGDEAAEHSHVLLIGEATNRAEQNGGSR